MTWKAIGNSVAGTSHVSVNKPCEDAIQYRVVQDMNGNEALICCMSDGAGSARYAGQASALATAFVAEQLSLFAAAGEEVSEETIYKITEDIYNDLSKKAALNDVVICEYSCTLLGCCLTNSRSVFFHIGDGAIVRNDGSDFYTPVWWPHNGEYQNTTFFIVDDPNLGNLHVLVLEEAVNEVAIFSDGMQSLALNMDTLTAHQPFFSDLFRVLRLADQPEKVTVLNRKLAEYLNSPQINGRTDDDKTLFLATRSAT